MSMEESIEKGLTVLYKVELTEEEADYLADQCKMIKDKKTVFDGILTNWIEAVNSNSSLMLSSDSIDYKTIPEFTDIENYIKNNCDCKALIMQRYVEKPDVYSQLLVYSFLFDYEGADEIAAEIVSRNNEISKASMNSDVYIAPSEVANTMDYIRYLMRVETSYEKSSII